MTFSLSTRAILTGLVLSTLPIAAQTAKPAANQGPYQPKAQASPFDGKVVEDIVARVNDQIITSSDYDRAEQQLETDARQQGISGPELEQRKKDLLRDLIDKELLLSKAKELQITGETELVKRLDEIRKQNHLDSMEDLEKAAQQQGVSYEDFKQNIRNEIISQDVIRDEVGRHIQLTKTDIANYYRAHQNEFEQPESVHLEEILIPVSADDPAALKAAQAKADDVEARLKAGGNFDELAKQDSSGPTAATGGDLGDFKHGMLAKPLEDAVFPLQTGGVTEPIRTKQGFLILKVTQHVGGSKPDLNAVGPQVEEAAFMSRMQPALRQYLATLRSQAYIDIRPGFQDIGATGSSVKPLYSAYTPPGKKKKPAVEKTQYRNSAHGFRSKTSTDKTSTKQTASTASTAKPAPTNTNAGKTTAIASTNAPSTKPAKKEKIRFGQAPRETLSQTPGATEASVNATTTDAGAGAAAAPNGETQVATNTSSNVTQPGEVTAPVVEKKTRFSYRAREPKQPKALTQDQLENQSVEQASTVEQAAQQTQAAPLGLAGDTATKKKKEKVKGEPKTRYAGSLKPTDQGADTTPVGANPTDASPNNTTPSPTAAQPTPPPSPQ